MNSEEQNIFLNNIHSLLDTHFLMKSTNICSTNKPWTTNGFKQTYSENGAELENTKICQCVDSIVTDLIELKVISLAVLCQSI